MSTTRGYRPIADYALIGDAHSAALIANDGSIDWCCWPRFDSPAVFCKLLDASKGGYFRISPLDRFEAVRSYLGHTTILTTTYTSATGRVRVTDCMPIEPRTYGAGREITPTQDIVRLVEGLEGSLHLNVAFRPTFNYARGQTDMQPTHEGAIASYEDQHLWLRCPAPLSFDPNGSLTAKLRVSAGERRWITLAYAGREDKNHRAMTEAEAESALARTLSYWNDWSALCTYRGPYEELVRRSALTLKLLTFNPTGALIAAPTTSLPEEIGGVRNWDYRYTWLRDSSLVLDALHSVGYQQEAIDFFDWLDELAVARQDRVRVVYTIDREMVPAEQSLDHLEGYRGSRPVRIGNGAATQVQLDVSGEILEAAHLCYSRLRPIKGKLWRVLRTMADSSAENWREPDQGLWEIRAAPRHFVHSKLLCWMALDRAIRLAATSGLQGDLPYWRRTRDEIRRAILAHGFNRDLGSFVQSFDSHALDASVLVIPLVGFLPATDPRVQSTRRRIQEQLMSHGLVCRYLNEDGIPGSEGSFALCSFWLVDNLAMAGALDEARELFERITSYANDVWLMSEELDGGTGELLGNFPQGFSHLALIRSAVNIARAEREGAETEARVPGERSPAQTVGK